MLSKELIPAQLPVLIRYRVMQSVGTNVPPEPIQANTRRSSFAPRYLENTSSNPQAGISRDHFYGGNMLSKLATSLRGQGGTLQEGTVIFGV